MRNTSFLSLLVGLLFLLLSSCGDDSAALAIYLKTDMVAGVEFSRIEVVLLEATEAGTAAGTLAQKRLSVSRNQSFGQSTYIATFDDMAQGGLVVLVQLVDSRGTLVLERRTRLSLSDNYALTVIMTRDCTGVMCPSPGGQPLFAACIAGQCVDERCSPDAPEFCPAFVCDPDTNDASACPPPADCAEAVCASGICLFPTREPSGCDDTEWCNPFDGCEPLMQTDMDGGIDDASVDDGGEGDAGVVDASSADGDIDDASLPFDASFDDAMTLDMDLTSDAGVFDAGMSLDLGSVDMGISCTGADVLCGDTCVDTRIDVHHCGDCDIDCTVLPNVNGSEVACASGVCQVGSACNEPFAHCSSDALDGCETNFSSPSSCGSCTSTCGGSTPLCASDESGSFACASGCNGSAPTLCGSTCVNIDTNPAACGGCGNVCPTSEHGRSTCTARSCGIVCDAGYHLCGDTCVSNYEVTSCGPRCGACSDVDNGYPTCDGTNCSFACDAGFHACGSLCVDNNSVSSCGSSCTTCPGAPAFATATCDGFACGFVCLSGYHRCGSGCVRDDSTSGCGAACITCSPPPSNGTAACISGVCSSSCNVGYHACGGSCSADNDPTHCGTSCTLCPAPTGGSATCSSGVCGTSCPAGTHLCGSACLSNTSTASCGTSSCTACTVPTNGVATCNGTSCGFTCDPGYTVVGGGCDLPAPRPVWPMTSQVMSSRTPTFRWLLAGITTGAEIQLCNDRACSSVISTTNVTGSSFTPSTPLPARSVVYWRLRARYGGNTGISTSATWQLTTLATSAPVSTALGDQLRDVNGDGISDIVAGAPTIGRAYVYHGHLGGPPSATPDATLMPSAGPLNFGDNVATCDVNGDGYADVIVSQWQYSSNNGRLYVYYSGPSGTSSTIGTTIEAPAGLTGARFGFLMDCAGDMNGDGYADVVASSVTSSVPGVYVFAGSATGLGTTHVRAGGIGGDSTLTRAIDSGDVNGDGYSDVMSQAGGGFYMTVFYGGAGWAPALPAQALNVATYGSAAIGDFDGDGYADVETFYIYTVQMSLQRGSPTGVSTIVSNTAPPDPGSMVTPPRMISIDMDTDPVDDLVISFPQGSEGRVYSYQGNSTSYFAVTPTQTIFNPTFWGNFGFSIANAGDVDGDGRADLVIGGLSELFYVHLGQASGVFTPTASATITSPVMMSAGFGSRVR